MEGSINPDIASIFPCTSTSVDVTIELGRQLGARLQSGDVVALYGDVGSGKTHFAKGIAEGLGFTIESVSSPTFSLMNIYEDNHVIYHFDMYRLNSEHELREIGLEDYLNEDTVSIIEWPEIAEHLLPSDTIRISIQHQAPTERTFRLL